MRSQPTKQAGGVALPAGKSSGARHLPSWKVALHRGSAPRQPSARAPWRALMPLAAFDPAWLGLLGLLGLLPLVLRRKQRG